MLTGEKYSMAEAQAVAQSLSAAGIIAAIKQAGIRFIVALPDRTTTEGIMKPMLKDPDFQVVQVCKEDEGLSICAGLHSAGHRSLMMMQYTGLLDSINAMRGVAMEGKNPICMLVGLLNKEPGVPPTQSASYGIRVVEPVLDAMSVTHHLVEASGDVAKIGPAIEKAYKDSAPVVLLVGASPR
jgi:sulfopyruvate decarboxylase subunit alpha